MSKGKWSLQSKQREYERKIFKQQRHEIYLDHERRRKLENLDTWFHLAEEIAQTHRFDWFRQLRMFIRDHDVATEFIIKLNNKLKGIE